MRLRVLLFGVLKDLCSSAEEAVELPAGATVHTLLQRYRERMPEQGGAVWSSLAVAVNGEYARASERLRDGDEVALLPPVSGGLASASGSVPVRVSLTRGTIPAAEHIASAKDAADGAVVIFDGIVRNNTRGRPTLHLHYEAYESMALSEMRKLATEAQVRFGVREITVVHRLGELAIGESSILIVVASAHRGAAFDACRYIIDTLKKTVPIWKKEFFVDGAVWSDGEAFPAEVGP